MIELFLVQDLELFSSTIRSRITISSHRKFDDDKIDENKLPITCR